MINGKKWDVYTPTTGSVDSILRMLSKKGSQVEGGGVIIDLSRSPLTLQDLRNANFFERAKNRSSKFSKVLVFT